MESEPGDGPTVECPYCRSRVIVPPDLRRTKSPETYSPPPRGGGNEGAKKFIAAAALIFAVTSFVFIVAYGVRKTPPVKPPGNRSIVFTTPSPRATASPTSDVLLTFGGEGTGDGQFKGASEIAVDARGRIYVADDTLRVQMFDATGKFVKTWLMPEESRWYRKARGGPDKLVIDRTGNLYVLIAGVILKFDAEERELLGAVHGSDYVHDVALMPDDGLVMVSQKGDDDELVRVDARGRPAGRTHRFASAVLEKPLEVRALRVAADGTGNVFSVYALGDSFGEFYHDAEDLAVLKFTPAGKYVTRLGSQGREAGQYETPGEIAVDRRGRVYVCDSSRGIHVYAADGRFVETVKTPFWVRGLALDGDDQIYVVGSNQVARLKARA